MSIKETRIPDTSGSIQSFKEFAKTKYGAEEPKSSGVLDSIQSLEKVANTFKYYLMDIENLRYHLKEEFEKNLPDTEDMKAYYMNIDKYLSDAHSDITAVGSFALQQKINEMAGEVTNSKAKDDGYTE